MPNVILYKSCQKINLPNTSSIPNLESGISDIETKTISESLTDGIEIGIWECSPGSFKRQVKEREFSHFISGSGIFTTECGKVFEFKGGDAIYFPANTQGTWLITESLRKSFIIIPSK